ncbi:MAG: type I glyceraldehyde-3-phosphate dehydrogenase [Xanthomonadaceae bacterium]|nr:type I glyceraldehyde-3-phosphate dehydrogenase [Xanthomonadaceae bacterium]
MAQIKVGLNGFGRIGRKIVRLALENSDIDIVAINDLGSIETAAHLLKYDSVHGIYPQEVRVEGSNIHVGSKKIKYFSEKDPAKLPWGDLGAAYVHECTGIFTDRDKAGLHINGGAKKVVISGPSKDADATICMGVNNEIYDSSKHNIVSNASCTTNCLAPVVKVIDAKFGLIRGTMMTVHSYTNDQRILDLPHKDLRRARAAAVSMIPTSTGAAKAIGLVLPHLKGKLDGLSMRVPTPNVSVVDLTCEVSKSTTKEEVNAELKRATQNELKGIMDYVTAELVSCDFNGNLYSSSVDSQLTMVMNGTMLKVIAWYDNESGFSQRMLDLTKWMNKK